MATFALTLFIIEFSNCISIPWGPADVSKNEMIRDVNDGFTITKEDKDYFSKMNSDDGLDNLESKEVEEDLRIVKGTEAKLGNTN